MNLHTVLERPQQFLILTSVGITISAKRLALDWHGIDGVRRPAPRPALQPHLALDRRLLRLGIGKGN